MKNPASVINHAESLLQTAKNGLEDMKHSPGRMMSGFQAAIMAGRAVTFALQNLRSISPDFEPWWQNMTAEMKGDRELSILSNLRTKIEKQGSSGTRNYGSIDSFKTDTNPFHEQPPEGTVGLFICDIDGNSGWLVKDSDGNEIKHYASLKGEVGSVGLLLEETKGLGMSDADAREIISRYLDYLAQLIAETRERFL